LLGAAAEEIGPAGGTSADGERNPMAGFGGAIIGPEMANDQLEDAGGVKAQTTETATPVRPLLKETADALEQSARLAYREARRKEDARQHDVAAKERQAGRRAHEAAQRALAPAADLSFALEAMAQEERSRAIQEELGAASGGFG
jgi:hypothetical protein